MYKLLAFPHSPALAAYNNRFQFIQPKSTCFQFVNALNRPYDTTTKNIRQITFFRGRTKKHPYSIEFADSLVTEHEAILAVENYFNLPLDETYYQTIKEDLVHNVPWCQAKIWFTQKGDCLTDGIFIIGLTREEEGNLIIETNPFCVR